MLGQKNLIFGQKRNFTKLVRIVTSKTWLVEEIFRRVSPQTTNQNVQNRTNIHNVYFLRDNKITGTASNHLNYRIPFQFVHKNSNCQLNIFYAESQF